MNRTFIILLVILFWGTTSFAGNDVGGGGVVPVLKHDPLIDWLQHNPVGQATVSILSTAIALHSYIELNTNEYKMQEARLDCDYSHDVRACDDLEAWHKLVPDSWVIWIETMPDRLDAYQDSQLSKYCQDYCDGNDTDPKCQKLHEMDKGPAISAYDPSAEMRSNGPRRSLYDELNSLYERSAAEEALRRVRRSLNQHLRKEPRTFRIMQEGLELEHDAYLQRIHDIDEWNRGEKERVDKEVSSWKMQAQARMQEMSNSIPRNQISYPTYTLPSVSSPLLIPPNPNDLNQLTNVVISPPAPPIGWWNHQPNGAGGTLDNDSNQSTNVVISPPN